MVRQQLLGLMICFDGGFWTNICACRGCSSPGADVLAPFLKMLPERPETGEQGQFSSDRGQLFF